MLLVLLSWKIEPLCVIQEEQLPATATFSSVGKHQLLVGLEGARLN